MKDGSLIINNLKIIDCKMNLFQNDASDISEMAKIETGFMSKDSNFVKFGSSDFAQILQACGKNS